MEYGHWKNSSQALFCSALELASRYSSKSSLMSSGRLKTSRYLAYLEKVKITVKNDIDREYEIMFYLKTAQIGN